MHIQNLTFKRIYKYKIQIHENSQEGKVFPPKSQEKKLIDVTIDVCSEKVNCIYKL